MLAKFYPLLLGSSLICLSSCSVYRPTVPLLPAIRQAHDLEVKVAADVVNDEGPILGAASVAYSPVRHLLLMAGGAGSRRSPRQGGYDGLQRHVEAGIGSYRPLRNGNVLSTQVGLATGNSFGQSIKGVGFLNVLLPSGITELQETHVSFRRWQAQVGWQHYHPVHNGMTINSGILYRFSRVFYKQYRVISTEQYMGVSDEPEIEYFPISPLNRHDIMLQLNLGLVRHPTWQIHMALGGSTGGARQEQPNSSYYPAIGKANTERTGTYIGEIGLNFYPRNFHKKSK